jgi:hypothetical protein
MPPKSAAHAPIAIFIYRRTDLLDQVLDALEACPEFFASPVYVFSDGAKSPAAQPDIDAARTLVRGRLRPNMTLIEAPANKGLARSISEGATMLCNKYGKVIVLEDDLVVSPAILTWFNTALDRYADDPQVMQVSGHMFEVPVMRRRDEGVLFPMTTSWGWATWKRAWDQFDPAATGWEALTTDAALRRRFNLGGRYPYARMMERQMRGEVDSWAIRWYWSVFQANGLGLFPPQSYVLNLGTDGAATHKSLVSRLRAWLPPKTPKLRQTMARLPDAIQPDMAAFEALGREVDDAALHKILRILARR